MFSCGPMGPPLAPVSLFIKVERKAFIFFILRDLRKKMKLRFL